MFNKQLTKNIKALDEEINKLIIEMTESEDQDTKDRLETRIDELTDIRTKLSKDKVSESHAREIISGLVGIGGIILVLKHEKTEVITSKAFSMATKMFRGV